MSDPHSSGGGTGSPATNSQALNTATSAVPNSFSTAPVTASTSCAAGGTPQSPKISPNLQEKILYGQRVANPNSPNGMSNEVIGGHSSSVRAKPDCAYEVLAENPDGTTQVRFVKQFSDGNLSKIKKSTLAPDSWSDNKIIEVTERVANSPPVAIRARDGATLHRQEIDGVQWEVICNSGGIPTSSYPTGGKPTNQF